MAGTTQAGHGVSKRILIATRTPEGLPGGSGFHLRNMIEVLNKHGHQCSTVSILGATYDAPFNEDEKVGLIGGLGDSPQDVIIADYVWMCSLFDVTPQVLKICFVHDLRCRIVPCLEAIGYKDAQGWTEEKEAELLRKADILLVLNEEDKAYCERMAPNCKIVRIGIAMQAVAHDPAKEIPGRCIYVGSPVMENQYAIDWFEKNVWPQVLKEVPHATLVKVMGGVKDLDAEYAQAQLAVVPHIMKGGIKLKVAEAFAHGIPAHGNGCAFDGFTESRRLWPHHEEPGYMAKTIVQYLEDDEWRKNMCEQSVAICKTQMTPHVAYGDLLDVLQ